LLVGSPLAFSSFLFLLRRPVTNGTGAFPGWARRLLGLLAVAYALLALGLLFLPSRLEEASPFALPGLSGRFVGSWCAFLAVLASFALWRNRDNEAAVPIVALLIFPIGAIVAGFGPTTSSSRFSRRLGYFVTIVLVAGVATAVLAGRRRSRQDNAATVSDPPLEA
jgi:hypothetical protein